MEYVTTEPGVEGLGAMIADLVRGNIAAHPDRAALLRDCSGTVNIHAVDAGVRIGLEFAANRLHVFSKPFRRPGLDITTDAETLMALTTMPLVFGQPDVRTPEGRAVVGKLVRRNLRVKGLVAHPFLLGRLQRLLSAS